MALPGCHRQTRIKGNGSLLLTGVVSGGAEGSYQPLWYVLCFSALPVSDPCAAPGVGLMCLHAGLSVHSAVGVGIAATYCKMVGWWWLWWKSAKRSHLFSLCAGCRVADAVLGLQNAVNMDGVAGSLLFPQGGSQFSRLDGHSTCWPHPNPAPPREMNF